MDAPSTKRSRVPRRTPKACQQCRTAKVRCSGSFPCNRCNRRNDTGCCFVDDQKVAVSERYLLELERRAALTSAIDASQLDNSAQPPTSTDAYGDGEANRSAPSGATTGWASSSTLARSVEGASVRTNAVEEEDSYDTRHPASIGSAERQHSNDDLYQTNGIFASNPLVNMSSSYLRDPGGRYRFMGPTSTWSFCRRTIALIEQRVPRSHPTPPDPFNNDGTAFQLSWVPLLAPEAIHVRNLPPIDYALYLFHTVKFHLGPFSNVIDEPAFLSNLNQLETDALGLAQSRRLWFVEYLLILAFGEAFGQRHGPSSPPAGSDFAARAMALMPDLAHLQDEGFLAIEVLSLAALYFYCIDMRTLAFQYIGQALRFSYIEGLHRDMPEDVLGPEMSRRLNNLWWTVYILDRHMAASLGSPSSIRDEDITMALPGDRDSGSAAVALTLFIKLSRVLATIMTTVYGADGRLGRHFIKTTSTIIKHLAEIVQECEDSVLGRNGNTTPSRMSSGITLMYHNCIVHATRPLVMCVLIAFLPSSTPECNQNIRTSPPIASLFKTSVASAMTILRILSSLEKHRLLESFLPFNLEYAFSSAMLLCILQTVLPDFVTDQSWFSMADSLLNIMIREGSVIAQLRQSELHHLEELLSPLRRSHVSMATPGPQEDINLASSYANIPIGPAQTDQGYTPRPELLWGSLLDMNTMNLDPEDMFDLALQLGTDTDIGIFGSIFAGRGAPG